MELWIPDWLVIFKVCASRQGGPFLQVQANTAFQDDGTGKVFPLRKNNFASTTFGTLVNGLLNNGSILYLSVRFGAHIQYIQILTLTNQSR